MRTRMWEKAGFCAVLSACAALLSTAGCGTKEVAPPAQVYVGDTAGPDLGAFIITFAPGAATYEEEQAWAQQGASNQYAVVVDGAELVLPNLGMPEPVVLGEGSEAGIGYLPAGPHHLAIAAPNGSAPIFAADLEIVAGAQNQLYLYGPHGAIQGRFLTYPSQPAAGTLHVSTINLVQGGATVEVVSCTRDSGCTSLSPPLGLGETFQADYPTTALDTWPYYTMIDGSVLGVRPVPTAAIPAPQVDQLSAGYTLVNPPSQPDPPANMVFAPLYISAEGSFLAVFE